MGVLSISNSVYWGSSKSLLEELLERVLDATSDNQQAERLRFAILGNYAHYSLEHATIGEVAEFDEAAAGLIAEWEARDDGTNPYLHGAIDRLKELRPLLANRKAV